jgi:apolipoprotein N-acyltransferase
VLLALSFPRYGHSAVSLVALLPLLLAVSGWRGRPGQFNGSTWRRGFALGTCAGMVHFGGTIYWTGAVVATFGGLPPIVAWLCAMALAAYMSIYLAAATAIVGPSVRAFGMRGLAVAPMAWMAGEFARGYVLGGFPWIPLGSATIGLLPLAQLASLVGVYGVSGFIVAYDALLLAAFTTAGRTRTRTAAAAVAMIAVASVWGSWRMANAPLMSDGTAVKVGLIQPNVLQTEKWDPRRVDEIAARFDAMTRQAVAEGAEVVLWPESSTPYLFNEDADRADRVRGLVRETGVPLLFGTDELERGTPEHFYNSAFMLDSGGALAAVYR